MSIRRLMLALVTAGSAMLAVAAAGAPAHASGFSPINVWNSSHCLDNATENNAKLQRDGIDLDAAHLSPDPATDLGLLR
jgi:hypothetical protein